MRPGSLRCPTCASQSIQDRATQRNVPWLVKQDAASRTLVSWLLVLTAVVLFAVAAFLAFIGITAGAGLFALLFFVFWGLLFARFGLYALQAGLEGKKDEPTDLLCLSCRTTWQVGAPTPAAPGAVPPAGPVVDVAPPPIPSVDQVSEVVAPGVAQLEAFIRDSVPDRADLAVDDAELERQRIDAVLSIARIGQAERAAGRDGRPAVDALVRLLDVGTGFVPELQIGAAKKTMRHHVIELLGRSGDPAAVTPLTEVLTAECAAYDALATSAAAGGSDAIGLRRTAMAEDQFETAADALAALGDPAALDALHETQAQVHFGMKRAVKRAIRTIESRRAA